MPHRGLRPLPEQAHRLRHLPPRCRQLPGDEPSLGVRRAEASYGSCVRWGGRHGGFNGRACWPRQSHHRHLPRRGGPWNALGLPEALGEVQEQEAAGEVPGATGGPFSPAGFRVLGWGKLHCRGFSALAHAPSPSGGASRVPVAAPVQPSSAAAHQVPRQPETFHVKLWRVSLFLGRACRSTAWRRRGRGVTATIGPRSAAPWPSWLSAA